MSTIAFAGDAPAAARPGSNRVLAVFRLYFVNPTQMVWQPLAILGFIFVINWLIWLIVVLSSHGGATQGMTTGTSWSGASTFAFVWPLVVATQAMNRTFPFALGFTTTRRDFSLGTALALTTLCAGLAIVVGILGVIEDATHGWGLGGHMFAVVYFGHDGPFARTWYVFLLMLAFAFLGSVAGALYVRWRTWGILGFGAAMALLILGSLATLALTNGWSAMYHFFAGLGFAGTFPLLLIPIVISGLVSWAALRGATARSGS